MHRLYRWRRKLRDRAAGGKPGARGERRDPFPARQKIRYRHPARWPAAYRGTDLL